MQSTSFYSSEELQQIKFKSVGKDVLISRYSRLYNVENIEIGNNVRIDDFCIISGNVVLHNRIHIGAYCGLYGKFGIEMDDFSGLSPRCTIFSASDDFGGEFLISPMVPDKFTNVTGGKVHLKKFSQVGAGTIILPGVTLNEGAAVGAMSFVKVDLEEWKIYGGNPVKFLKKRKDSLKTHLNKF